MALDFPNTPTADQEFVTPKVTFAWTGATRWRRKDGSTPPPVDVLPTLTQLIPASGTVNAPDITVRVLGTEFVATTELIWNGVSVQRTLVSATEMTVLVPLTGATVGIVQVAARNGTLTSNELPFEYTAPLPMQATFLDPNHVLVNTACPIKVYGNSLTATCKIWIAGGELPTVFVSDTELTATMPANATAGPVKVWVIDNNTTTIPPTAGLDFTYDAVPLVISSLNPGAVIQGTVSGGGPNVTINGSGFNPNCWALVSGVLNVTTYVSPTQLTIMAIENRTVGTFPVRVRDTQTMVESNTVDFFVTSNQPPALTSVNPSTAVQGTTIATLTVTGQNFVNGKRIKLDGVAKTTTYVNATTLTTTAVVCPYSVPWIAVTVEDCPGEVKVNLTGAPGSVTITALVPNSWPNDTVGEPHHGKNTVRLSVGVLDSDEVYVNGVYHDSWLDNGGLMFQASYMGGDPNIIQRLPVQVKRGGVWSSNHEIIYIGSP